MSILNRADVQTAIATRAASVLDDETGAESKRCSGELIELVGGRDAADWLFDHWGAVLEACATLSAKTDEPAIALSSD